MTEPRQHDGDWSRAVLVLVCEALLFVVLWVAAPVLGSVPISHFGHWVATADPTTALTATSRLAGLVLTGWLFLSTCLYVLLRRSGWRLARSGVSLLTARPVRRLIDGAAAASILVSAVTTSGSSPASVPAAFSVPAPPLQKQGPVPSRTPGAGQAEAGGYYSTLPAGTKVYVVQPGDCLSVIAQDHLGDWRRDVEIDQLNRGREQADGRALTDDHWIYPGWVLVMPPDAVGTQVVAGGSPTAATAPPSPKAPGPESVPGPLPGVGSHGGGEPGSGASVASLAGQRSDPLAGRRPSSGPDPGRVLSPGGADRGVPSTGGQRLPVAGAGVSALAAAAFVWGINRRRREMMHGRVSRGPIRRSARSVERADARARSTARQAGIMGARIDLAMRYLGASLAGRAGSAPAVAMVRADDRGLEVLVVPPDPAAPRHFEAIEGGAVWVLDPDLDLSQLEELAAEAWPFLPALVCLGRVEEAWLLVNLEHAGSLGLEGPPDQVGGLLAQWAMELRTQPWAHEMLDGLYALGLGRGGALQQSSEGQDGLASAARRARTCQAELALAGSAAVRRAATCQWLPRVVMAGTTADQEVVAELVAAAVPDRSALAVVAAAGPGSTEVRWRLRLEEGGAALLQGKLGSRSFAIAVQVRSDPAEVELLEEALAFPLGAPKAPPAERSTAPPPEVVVSAAEAGREPALVGPPAAQDQEGEDDDEDGRELEERGVGFSGWDDEVADPYWEDDEIIEDVDPELAERWLAESEELAHSAVEVRILGPVGLAGGAPEIVPANRRAAALAILAYLAVKGRPASADELSCALWPADDSKDNFGEPRRKTVMNVISRARAMLGANQDGSSRLVLGEGGYSLHATVQCDLARFLTLVRPAASVTDEERMKRLRRALEMVAGPPFMGSLANPFYEWVSAQHLDLAISGRVVDAAEELGWLAVETGDHQLAEWAVRKGLELEPAREELYQVWMHAQGRAGRPDQVEEIYRRVCRAVQRHIDPGLAPKEETQAARDRYVRGRTARV